MKRRKYCRVLYRIFLDSLTEEVEETAESAIHDDYEFSTPDELDKLDLSNLIGTNLPPAYMHGFFVDAGLDKKAKSIVEPFNYEDYKSQKIKEKLQAEQSESRVKVDKLSKVNAALATTDTKGKKKRKSNFDCELWMMEKTYYTSTLYQQNFKVTFEKPTRDGEEEVPSNI